MSLNMGWTAAQGAEYLALCRSPHQVVVDVSILDQNHRYIKNISGRLIGGNVDIDASADVTRSAHLILADPLNDLGINPSDIQNQFRWLIQIHYGIAPWPGYSEFTQRIWWIPLFTGPLTDITRDGITLDVECQGKEVMASGPGVGVSLPKGWTKMSMMAFFMVSQGELLSNFIFETTAATAPGAYQPSSQPLSWEPGTNMWREFKTLLEAQSVQPFYDAYGRLRFRVPPEQPVFQFDNTWLTQRVEPKLDMGALANTWQVIGGTPAGYNGRVRAEATLPWWHPLSPVMLTRDGKTPRYIRGTTQDDNILTIDEAQTLAARNLGEAVMLSYDVEMTSLIAPFLEEYDMCLVNTPQYYGPSRFIQCSIPLVGDLEMSVGFLSTSGKVGLRGRPNYQILQKPTKKKVKKKNHKSKKKNKGKKKKPLTGMGVVK